MSLKDRHAKSENRSRDRTAMADKEMTFDMNVIRGMVPVESAKGQIEQDRGANINQQRGLVAMPWPSAADGPTNTPVKCTATTKKGNPCKAAPVSGQALCIGHQRASDSN